MLSTPPAFILSQDQTLILKFCSGQILWLTPVFLNRQNQVHYLISFADRIDYGLCLFISIVQFSRINLLFSSENYFIKSSFVCQALFLLFFRACFCLFRCHSAANDIISCMISLVKHFFVLFFVLISLFLSADISISSASMLVKVFLSKHSCFFHPFSAAFLTVTVIYYTHLSKIVNCFFHFFHNCRVGLQ